MEHPLVSERLKTVRNVANLRQGRNDWYRIENIQRPASQASSADIYIYDEIGYFGVSAADFVRDLASISVDEINLHINSPGGDVFDGVAIYQAIKDHNATVTTYVDSLAASAASFIAMAGNEVIIQRNAQMMIHDAHGLCIGNATDMQEMIDMLNRCSDNIADIYAQKAGGTVEDWRSAMRAETWYSAHEAVDAGLADRIGGSNEKAESAENTWDLSVFAYSGRANAPAPSTSRTSGTSPEPALAMRLANLFQTAVKEADKS